MTTSHETVHVLGQRMVREKLSRLGYRIAGSTDRGIAFHAALGSRSIPIRVKTIRHGAWQSTTSNLMDIVISPDGVQTVRARIRSPYPDLVCVLVKLDEDAYFILTLQDLYDATCTSYETWLAKHHGRRPRNPNSTHCAVYREDLVAWEENWDLIKTRLTA